MNYKIVYQTDLEGIYIGEEKAYESPLQPGTFLIPARSVEIQPPILSNSEKAKWDGAKWNVVDSVSLTPTFSQLTSTWEEIRVQRNTLLAASDWTQFADVPLSEEEKSAWLTYRAALRNIPQVYSEPSEVVWPVKP